MDQQIEEKELARALKRELPADQVIEHRELANGELCTIVRTPRRLWRFDLSRNVPESADRRDAFLREIAALVSA